MADRSIFSSVKSAFVKAVVRRQAVRISGISLLLTAVAGMVIWASGHWATHAAAVTTLDLANTADLGLTMQDEQGKGAVVAGYEGMFDPQTKQLVIRGGREITQRVVTGRTINGRVDPNAEIPRDGTGYSFTVVNSTFLTTGDQAGNISGEIRLNNLSNSTLYNTRVLFTRFRLCPPSGTCDGTTANTDASTTPGAAGFAYYNDGLIPYQGKLHVSRAYGDIAANGNASAVWSFNVSTTPARFFFSFVVLSDWGVATESVYPAAVQVNTSSGASVVIRGRGFTGTPTVNLLNASGVSIGNLSNVTVVNDTQITATVPAGTAVGSYGVRVTLAGGTAGGKNSSAVLNRLTVTPVPTAGLSGTVTSLSGAGPYLVTSDLTVSSALVIPPGTVFYVGNGVRIVVNATGALNANGGVPGVPNGANISTPNQIVFTSQRSPGAGIPAIGAWAGLDMTAAGAACLLRNTVVEFGGANNGAAVNLTGSGRTLQFTDSIARFSAGNALAANGAGDSLIGFARNRIEYNGQSAATPAMLLSANAALGLFEIPDNSVPTGTSIGDAGYFYASGNDFTGNTLDAIQIGTDAGQTTNDFTRSGVLVGQGNVPLQIRGSNSNPAVVGTVSPLTPAELTIAPGALIQLAAGMDFQAGDYGTSRVGCIAANGFAGVNQVGGASLANSRYIVFDRIPNNGNFGSIFFARNSLSSCLLSFVQVRFGGAGIRGNGAVISEGANLTVRNTQVTNSSTAGIVELQGGLLAGTGTSLSSNATTVIDTVAGGLFGDGNLASEATVLSPLFAATDTQGRGVFFIDGSISVPVMRFVNTTRNPVTIAGKIVPAGTMKTLAGGGLDIIDNVAGIDTDLGIVTGLAVSNNGNVVYFIDSITPAIRFLNISGSAVNVNGTNIDSGKVGTLAQGSSLGTTVVALAVHPTTGDVYFCDAANNGNRVYRVAASGGTPVVVAGSGASTTGDAVFEGGPPTSLKLLEPRALAVTATQVFVADTGHNRVINVGSNPATLVVQFPAQRTPPSGSPYKNRPFPAGLAVAGGQLYIANRAAHNIVQADGSSSPADYAGVRETTCEYSTETSCGDGGSRTGSRFKFLDSGSVGIAGDTNGLFVCDQPGTQGLRGRIRYINVTGNPVEVAGKIVNGNNIDTVFGSGLLKPFDTGLANAALLSAPAGVAVDPANGNLWISEGGNLRYVNRTPRPVTLFAGTTSAVTIQPGRIATMNSLAGNSDSTDNVQIVFGGFDTTQGLWVTAEGVYIADARGGPGLQGSSNPVNRRTSRLRFVNTTSSPVTFYPNISGVNGNLDPLTPLVVDPGQVKTILGGNPDPVRSAGDGPDPLAVRLVGAVDVAVAPNGDIYCSETGNKRVRRVSRSTGTVTSLPLPGATDPGVTNSAVNAYSGLTFDSQGRLWIADAGSNAILRESSPGSGQVSGGFVTVFSGSPLNSPRDVAVDSSGSFAYVTNAGPLFPSPGDHRIIRLTLSGNTSTAAAFAGTSKGYSGDYGAPLSAQLNLQAAGIVITVQGGTGVLTVVGTENIVVGLNGEILFTDTANNAIRRIR